MEKRNLYEFEMEEWREFNNYLESINLLLSFSAGTIEDLESPGKVTAYYFNIDYHQTYLFPYPRTRLEEVTKDFFESRKV